jgi:hypothetical protein
MLTLVLFAYCHPLCLTLTNSVLPLPLSVLLLLRFTGAVSVFTIARLTIVFSTLRLPLYSVCGPISWAYGIERFCFSGYADS